VKCSRHRIAEQKYNCFIFNLVLFPHDFTHFSCTFQEMCALSVKSDAVDERPGKEMERHIPNYLTDFYAIV